MILLEYPFFSIEECDEIKKYAYEKEIILKKIDYISYGKTPAKKYNTSITTNNFDEYNFLKDNPIYADRLLNLLKKTNAPLEWPILVQCWVNIYREGDGIGWHYHYGNGFSFNIFVDGNLSPGPAWCGHARRAATRRSLQEVVGQRNSSRQVGGDKKG